MLAGGVVAWAYPRPRGDVFLALAGGREVLEGGLGAPDTWSFASAGRVWVHQNWGADALIYLAERAGGETGLRALKALLLALVAGAMLLAARGRGTGTAAALLAAGAALAAWPGGMTLRANLFSLVLAPLMLWLLHRSRSCPPRVWLAAALVGVWANLHGAFLFGLGMLGLWSVTRIGAAVAAVGWRRGLRRSWVFPAATLAAGVLAAFGTPFGIAALRVPFRLGGSEAWQTVTEWLPVFDATTVPAEMPWVFLAMGALVVVALLKRFAGRGRTGTEDRAVFYFELVLAALLIVMALRARRFVLFSSVMLAPLAARALDDLVPRRRRETAVLVAGTVFLAAVVIAYRGLPAYYASDFPLRPPETTFQRLVNEGTDFPRGAARFLVDNGISGRVFQEWRWEGYLRWKVPALKTFVGGRAHQIYTDAEAARRRQILGEADPAASLAAMEVSFALVPLGPEYGGFVQRLLRSPDHRWAYLYVDLRTALLVDVDAAPEWTERLRAGALRFADPADEALSLGMGLGSPALAAPPGGAVEALQRAVTLRPVFFAYALLADRALAAGTGAAAVAVSLEGEVGRLGRMPVQTADGVTVLDARRAAAGVAASLYGTLGRRADQERMNRVAGEAAREMARLGVRRL